MRFLIRDVQMVDVLHDKIVRTDILMGNGVFERIEPDMQIPEANDMKVIYGNGLFALPGLIDSHSHVELSMLSSTSFAEAVLNNGTTAAVLDAHDAVNVLGPAGAKYLMQEMKNTPLTPVWMASPCVPSAPGYEDCYGQVGLPEVRTMIEEYGMYGIAEAMDYNRVIQGEASLAEILSYAREKKLMLDGHAPCVRGKDLDLYIAAGVQSDHESITVEEMQEKHDKGMIVIIRRGSLKEPASAKELLKRVGESERVLLSTDGCITVQDILKHGHMNYALAQLTAEGVSPIRAVKMATIYPAKVYGLSHMGAIEVGRKADLLLVKDLEDFKAVSVYVDGMPLLPRYNRESFPDEVTHSIHHRMLREEDIHIDVPQGEDRVKVNILSIVDGTLETRREKRTIRVKENRLCMEEDMLYCAVADRYREEGTVGTGIICGAGCFKGAVAGSIAQDTQNLIGFGNKEEDLALAMNEVIKRQGGVAFVQNGQVRDFLPLPVMGILSQKPIVEFAQEVERLLALLKQAGITLKNPLLTMSLQIPLAVIPELAITNRGLLDITQNRFIPVCELV